MHLVLDGFEGYSDKVVHIVRFYGGAPYARLAQLGRAVVLQTKGRWFNPTIAHHLWGCSLIRKILVLQTRVGGA